MSWKWATFGCATLALLASALVVVAMIAAGGGPFMVEVPTYARIEIAVQPKSGPRFVASTETTLRDLNFTEKAGDISVPHYYSVNREFFFTDDTKIDLHSYSADNFAAAHGFSIAIFDCKSKTTCKKVWSSFLNELRSETGGYAAIVECHPAVGGNCIAKYTTK